MLRKATIGIGTALDPVRAGPVEDGAERGTSKDIGQDTGRISVDLLGGLCVRAGGATMGPRELGGAKPRHVLVALLLNRGRPVSKDRLVTLLWGGSPPSCATATLEGYVCVLRKRLQPLQTARGSLITTMAGCYAIDMSRVDLDLVRYEHLVAAGLAPATSAADALPMLQEAMALAQCPLLPEEVESPWLDDARRTHKESVRVNLIAAAEKVSGLSAVSSERWARLALEIDPLDESAWHALLTGMEASGHHARGLQTYDQCRRLFSAELGCAPGPGLQSLYVRLLRGANEDNDELSQLLDSVVRLHMAGQVGSGPAATEPGVGVSQEVSQEVSHHASVEQAIRALNHLVRSVRRRPGRSDVDLSA
jgi:DNA-binding SARP family transcriptional activator